MLRGIRPCFFSVAPRMVYYRSCESRFESLSPSSLLRKIMANQLNPHYAGQGVGVPMLLAMSSLVVSSMANAAADVPVQGQLEIVSSTGQNGDAFTGIDINALVGANRFYDAGYFGARATQANIEAALIWDGHETLLNHVQHDEVGTAALNSFGDHPTMVGQIMGGMQTGLHPGNAFEQGIAPAATLWSGAIATADYGDGGFDLTLESTASVYSTLLKTGVNGQTADVFNSSWTFGESTGNNSIAMGVDGLLYETGKVGVAAVGNDGSGAVSGIAAGYNTIAVGSLGGELDAVPYNQVSYFSSHGPNDYYNPLDNSVISGVRSKMDITAPGESLTLAIQTPAGETGNDWYFSYNSGTSFAAPIVAGTASLVTDVGRDIYAGDSYAIDGRVVKAVLLNGADKTQGWDNGQVLDGGVVTTTQSLDFTAGAGRLDLNNTFDQYVDKTHGGLAGTTDVAGMGCILTGSCELGLVSSVGWDFAWSNQSGENYYLIENPLYGGQRFTTTLDWFADLSPGSSADFSGAQYNHLANLDLMVFQYDPFTHAILDTVAQSISVFNQTEHLSFILPSNGYYGLEVKNQADLFNFTGASGEYYGLAWSVVPEPSLLALWSLGLPILAFRCRRIRRSLA
jgi:hypothetical protein